MGAVTHGYCRTPTYNCWANMIGRCTNAKRPDFRNYGGRGIYVCARWLCFKSFLEDMGEKPPRKTLERDEVNGPYSPENCRWATVEEQNNNRRGTLFVEIDGRRMSAKQAATALSVPYERMRWAVRRYGDDWRTHIVRAAAAIGKEMP